MASRKGGDKLFSDPPNVIREIGLQAMYHAPRDTKLAHFVPISNLLPTKRHFTPQNGV